MRQACPVRWQLVPAIGTQPGRLRVEPRGRRGPELVAGKPVLFPPERLNARRIETVQSASCSSQNNQQRQRPAAQLRSIESSCCRHCWMHLRRGNLLERLTMRSLVPASAPGLVSALPRFRPRMATVRLGCRREVCLLRYCNRLRFEWRDFRFPGASGRCCSSTSRVCGAGMTGCRIVKLSFSRSFSGTAQS